VRERFPRIVFLFACAVSLALPLAAQSTDGTINGRVLDPSNKVIGGADILVINDATGVQYSGKTNEDGIYVVPNLPPGAYRLQVAKVGFKTVIKPDIVLNIQDALSINFTLPIGAVFEIVTVEGGASMINTTDASVSTVIDHTYVENMPLNGRSFQDLILLTPGIVTMSPQQAGAYQGSGLGMSGEFTVAGQRTESNYYTVDGVSGNVGATTGTNMLLGPASSGSLAASTALGTTHALVSVDDLQEFRVQSSSYSAEYGRNPGGQFAFETKSGTNQFHGTAYDYLRNNYFDADDWFNDYFGVQEPPLRQNDFGGTLGGPVEIPGLYRGKDRTFFFASYEGLRLIQPQPASINYVPDLCLRGVNPTTNCTGTNTPAPAPLSQVLKAFPIPNGPDIANGLAEYTASWSNPSSIDSTSVRVDHVVNDKLRVFFRFSDTGSSATSRGTSSSLSTPSVINIDTSTTRTYTAGIDTIFRSRLTNDARLNYSSTNAVNVNSIDAFGENTPVNLYQLSGLGTDTYTEVVLLYGGYYQPIRVLHQSGAQIQWNLVDTVSAAWGRHQFKYGVDYRRLAPIAAPFAAFVPYYFTSEAAVETNSAVTYGQAYAAAYPLYMNLSVFAQDGWRVSQRLSLSLGLRWEVNPAPGVTQGLHGYTVQGTSPNTWTIAPQGTALWRTTWYNVAPRLGVAYILRDTPGWETVVRSGGGVFFDTGQQLGALTFWGGPGFSAFSGLTLAPFPVAAASIVPVIVNPPAPPYSLLVGYAPHLQLPYTLEWNTSIEQAMGRFQTVTVSYVGSHAARLLKEAQFATPGNPNTQEALFVENGLTSDYDSLQIQFRRRLSRGLTALASYTWSHCMDYGSENYSFGYQRGNCDFDIRHNVSAAFSYDLPAAGHDGFVNTVLHNWGLDDRFTARTAFPVTLVGNQLLQPTGQLYDGGLSFVTGQPVYLYGTNCTSVLQGLGDLQPGQKCPGGRAINPNAFTAVDSGLGDAPRNFARGFGAWQMDMAFRRTFPIHDRLKLQFRAEAFNVFNHPNFGTINPNVCSGSGCTFGQATGTLASSLGVLSPLYQVGGPRSMQFALKAMF